MRKNILRIIMLAALVVGLTAEVRAQSQGTGVISFSWSQYTGDPTVSTIQIYAITGTTNGVFSAGNTNAVLFGSTSVTNSTLSVSNVISGFYTFTATALSTNGLQSANSAVVGTTLLPGQVTNFKITANVP